MFHHEKLRVYQRSLEFAAWSQILIHSVSKKTTTRDQLERAGDSVALNIAEGNGKFLKRDRAGFFQIAHGSTLESAACLDLFVARGCCEAQAITKGKAMLEEIVKMLFAMLDRLGCRIAEDEAFTSKRQRKRKTKWRSPFHHRRDAEIRNEFGIQQTRNFMNQENRKIGNKDRQFPYFSSEVERVV